MTQRRSRSRHLAVQAIYQWQMSGQDVGDIINHFLIEQNPKKFEVDYFRGLVRGVATNLTRLDEVLSTCIDRDIEQVDPVERAVLRMSAFEFTDHLEVPYKVVINEAVELAKTFGADQGHRYVNGVLDRLALSLRPLETAQKKVT